MEKCNKQFLEQLTKLNGNRINIRKNLIQFMKEWEKKTHYRHEPIYGFLFEEKHSWGNKKYYLKTGDFRIHYANSNLDLDIDPYFSSRRTYDHNHDVFGRYLQVINFNLIKKIIINLPSAINEINEKANQLIEKENNLILPKIKIIYEKK